MITIQEEKSERKSSILPATLDFNKIGLAITRINLTHIYVPDTKKGADSQHNCQHMKAQLNI